MDPPSTITLARRLRRSMTRSEVRLWQALRGKQVNGVRFRRQHVPGPYVVDFFCSARQLAIEIDGDAHRDEAAQMHDARRDAWMNERGIAVLRIPDQVVRDDFEAALNAISKAVLGR